jgi:arylsulfatase A-like enzyme
LGFVVIILGIGDSSIFTARGYESQTKEPWPNIILLTVDGVNASHLNLYGYERQTTPFLSSHKDKLIFSNNHFTNSGNTSGSTTAILTGKLPTTTRVLYPPDILRGNDTIEHLPAILKEKGYHVAQYSVQHFVDAINLNFQNGFSEANGVSINSKGLAYRLSQSFPSNSKLFLQEVESRLSDRLGHIFFVKDMENTFTQITQTQLNFNDMEKIEQANDIIKNHEEPVFVHVHWMGTHGSRFYPISTEFSEGIDRASQDSWNQDLYDDAILDFDNAIAYLYNFLEEIQEVEDTIILVTSDHGQKFTVKDRLPLILLLPNSWLQDIPDGNTQNIDIAPTILDILEIPKPYWMQGDSIFRQSTSDEIIFALSTHKSMASEGKWTLDPAYVEPPFFQFDSITTIDCDKVYRLDLEKFTWSKMTVANRIGVCPEDRYLMPSEIRSAVIEKLKNDKFEFDEDLIPEIH